MSNTVNRSTNPVRPAPLACLECRRKHLKCDGGTPVCGRCRKAQSDCQYTPSRRGYKPSSKPSAAPSTVSGTPRPERAIVSPISSAQSPFSIPSLTMPGIPPSQSLDRLGLTSTDRPSLNPNIFALPSNSSYPQGDDFLFDYYYAFFHDAHPILPPAHLLPRIAPIPPCLQAVVRFIGAHYTLDPSADLYRDSVVSELAAANEPSFYKVQALLLLSIVLHARNERSDAVDSFSTAVELALGMGMNRASFASTLGENDPVRIETLRRTWWELYMVDGMFSAFDQMPSRINNASRILKRTLDLGYVIDDYQLGDQVESIDASIGSWFHHLPISKRNILGPDGTVDQLLFRAHMIINCALIYLHLPRSNLLATPTAVASIPCARRGLCIAAASSTNLTHAVKSIKAANDLAALAALRTSVIKHSPFFICGLVLSAIVQLCACSVRASNCLEPRRDRIALIVGELKSLNATWAISQLVMKQIKLVAREVLEIGVQQPIFPALEDQGPDISSIISSDMWLGDIPIEQ
ncbi:predicted protein [Uncinocarpus reesii 1704]|uniref:Zn(2)-C6 fungal-type domain-containing protein n=1 Tax=Uncinocarpus reesii (strain UAMH 1704) TaxID=336963 RepID=C4JJ65_UNCRE|nr:uncharacterized protein UREG_01672 [Uncinocarpus reesii 1704]EEP76823.1 predicted protein [Uncinocarpus reesii 1704]